MKMEIYDATGQATCRACNRKIEEGKQVKANLGTGKYAGIYHIKCFKENNWTFIHDLFQTFTDAEREDILRD